MENLKLPPHSLTSEQAILGAIFMKPKIIPEIQIKISASDFYRDGYAKIYESMVNLHKTGNAIEPQSVATELERNENLERAGGVATIYEIIKNVSTSAGWKYHANAIRDASVRRELISVFNEAKRNLFETNTTSEILSTVKTEILNIESSSEDTQTVHVSEIIPSVLESLEKGVSMGVKSGFYGIDKVTMGWQSGDLIIIAGRPGMGKSVMAKDCAENSGVPTLYFSLEMSKEQLIKRHLSGLSGVDHDSLRSGKLGEQQWASIASASNKLGGMPIYYNDSGKITIGKICAISETYKMTKGIGLVVVDYLGLIRSDVRGSSREQEVSSISRDLKMLARSLNIPVIVLAQLNRDFKNRSNKIPVLSDLRESGAIEQDADFVGFLHRPWMFDTSKDPTEAHFYLAKGRNTRTGKIDLIFRGENQVFQNPWRVN